jgi:hypothetical protein
MDVVAALGPRQTSAFVGQLAAAEYVHRTRTRVVLAAWLPFY